MGMIFKQGEIPLRLVPTYVTGTGIVVECDIFDLHAPRLIFPDKEFKGYIEKDKNNILTINTVITEYINRIIQLYKSVKPSKYIMEKYADKFAEIINNCSNHVQKCMSAMVENNTNLSKAEKIIKSIKDNPGTTARNSMGCSENWYDPWYAIYHTFTEEEILNMSDKEIDLLEKLGNNIADNLY